MTNSLKAAPIELMIPPKYEEKFNLSAIPFTPSIISSEVPNTKTKSVIIAKIIVPISEILVVCSTIKKAISNIVPIIIEAMVDLSRSRNRVSRAFVVSIGSCNSISGQTSSDYGDGV
ncbi:MAG: hypothetical protein U9O98_10785 [Asgard group archaeon]|nr:hypothetical protein [Asgard group archaeon]